MEKELEKYLKRIKGYDKAVEHLMKAIKFLYLKNTQDIIEKLENEIHKAKMKIQVEQN